MELIIDEKYLDFAVKAIITFIVGFIGAWLIKNKQKLPRILWVFSISFTGGSSIWIFSLASKIYETDPFNGLLLYCLSMVALITTVLIWLIIMYMEQKSLNHSFAEKIKRLEELADSNLLSS